MAIYSERWPTVYAINTVTELELTTSQNVTNNYTRVSYVVRVKKVNNTNDNWTPASGGSYLTLSIGGNSVRSNYRSNWTTSVNSRDVTAVVDSGYTDVYHNADGTKTINFSMSLNPNVSAISNMANRTISGSFVAATIPRASTFTVSNSLTTGSAYTVTITRSSTSFMHRVYRKIGSSEVELTSSAIATSHSINMPHSLFNSYPNTSSISASIIVKTFNGATQIGSASQNVTINLVSTAIPTNSGTTWSNSDSTPLSSNQMIRGVSRLTLGTGTVAGSYSSTISSYEFSYQIVGSDWTSAVNSSTRAYTYPAFNFPTSESVVLNIRSRVKDSRGRYSDWSTATSNSAIRVHHYAPPSIGNISVKRAGSGNTTLQVYRSHSVTPLYQGGSTSGQKNTANLRFQTRELGGSTVSSNTGGTSTSLSTAAAWVNLASAFTANKSYQVRAVLSDARQTVYGSWVTVGTEFVPLDIGPKGIGVGKVHSDASYDLEVGIGGIRSEGNILINGVVTGNRIDSTGSIRSNGTAIEQGRHSNFKTFTVGGTANNYYPVIISSQATFGFHRYSISRGYNWPAPDTWNNSTHKGGLTFDFEWSGDTNWGGNDKTVRVIEWNETYSTMVGGLKLARTGGLVVWLRGGRAQYRLSSERGVYAGVEVKLSGFTDGSGENFPVRSSPVSSEVYGSYPVRGTGALYEYGHRVITTNTIGSHIPDVPHVYHGVYTSTKQGRIEASTGRTLHGIAEATGNSTSTFNSLDNTVVFPIAFSTNTNYPISVTYSISSNVTPVNTRIIAVNIRDVTRTGFKWDARDSASGTSPSGGTKYTLHWSAFGTR